MSFNVDIALDELKKLSVDQGFKDWLVEKTHEFFGTEPAAEPVVEVEPNAGDTGAEVSAVVPTVEEQAVPVEATEETVEAAEPA